ncbi:ribosomal lysine N-methyltransferase 3 isoform X1 [Punica granatum]|uniref:N-lysine methyltransferase n=1 Tax=Punica granatum TaxID=22663 RepID=A0A6P8E9S4_PUNGR|nr:ribosomal lysine N-methyltransferase 3 isoform X1 [Punica granatum]
MMYIPYNISSCKRSKGLAVLLSPPPQESNSMTSGAGSDSSRRLRAFKRWMKWQSIECSDALQLTDSPDQGIAVRARCDLKEGDAVATIPKTACLTIKTTGAQEMIEAAGLEGCLGLSVALMFERSLGQVSPWAGYLQLLPPQEPIPLTWTSREVDLLLRGTELHKAVKEDKALIREDWKECILPLLDSFSELNPGFFGVNQYLAARSLIASRSFEIDDYHGFGMVPLADLFNHKTAAEDVHFTSLSSHSESDNDDVDDDQLTNVFDEKALVTSPSGNNSESNNEVDHPPPLPDDFTVLGMIMVKDVRGGNEVFNTYGSLGNAALLYRYGFTEENNPYDIVNIDLELVLQWSSSSFSNRHTRARVALWRRLGYSGCESQDSEYFEISFNGEPQLELLILLYIILLPEDAHRVLDLAVPTKGSYSSGKILPHSDTCVGQIASEMSRDLVLTESVCNALLSLAYVRESLYGMNTIEDDVEALRRCCCNRERKLYHSLMLRVSERRILGKLRSYASFRGVSFECAKASERKKLKRK